MMDRLLREGNPPTGQLASPKPQYKDVQTNNWEELKGEGGASYVKDKDALAKLEQVRQLLAGVATENKLEQARTLLDAISTKDFATSSKQDALNIAVEGLKSELILVKSELATIRENQLSGDQKVQLFPQYKDVLLDDWAELQGEGGASYVKDRDALAKLEQVRVLLAGVATETKLEEARALLESVAGKDFATQATLAQVKSELELAKAELATIKANQLSGDQKVQLKGQFVERVVLDVTDNGVGYTDGSSARYAVGRNVRIRTSASSGNGFLPIDCRGLVSLSMSLENPSSGDRQFFDHWGVIYYDSLGPFNVLANRVSWESVDFGEVPPGSWLVVDLMPYVRRGYMSIGILFHTYDPSDTPGEYTFHFRGVRSLLGVPDGDS